MKQEKNITLTIGDQELEFKVTTTIYDQFQNAVTADKKVSPGKNFLRTALVDRDQRPLLDDLCDRGLTLELVGELAQEFRGEIEIAVKKSSAG